MKKQIKYFYVILNDGVNLATQDKQRALNRISELLDLMQLERNKDWRIELSWGC